MVPRRIEDGIFRGTYSKVLNQDTRPNPSVFFKRLYKLDIKFDYCQSVQSFKKKKTHYQLYSNHLGSILKKKKTH